MYEITFKALHNIYYCRALYLLNIYTYIYIYIYIYLIGIIFESIFI